jgi:hypothetical protein
MRDNPLVYGYVFWSVFHETGTSERGAKSGATQSNSTLVGYRSPINNMFIPTARKADGKWTKVTS